MIQPTPVEYPTSDGQPMAETEAHADCMIDLIDTVRHHLADPQRWHVHGNQLFYYVQGDPRASFSPDVYVIEGVPQLPRWPIWKLWEEPRGVPRVAFELTSPSSIRKDLHVKRELYDGLGVEEYVVYDVLRQTSGPALRVWRRHEGELRAVEDSRSVVLGVGFRPEDWRLRLIRADGTPVPSAEERAEEEAARAAAAEERAGAAEERAAAEASRVAELEEQVAALRAKLTDPED